jgi:catechol 2,3-dioxygenase-like lactoylglutathione lyase family enzyme
VTGWASGIGAITLFTEDLPASRAFYAEVFRLPKVFEDDVSIAFSLGGTILNVLAVSEAPELITPTPVAGPGSGARLQFTIEVDDVVAVIAELTGRGVELLNGPIDRPWGVRTAAFADPAGHVWELAQQLPKDGISG